MHGISTGSLAAHPESLGPPAPRPTLWAHPPLSPPSGPTRPWDLPLGPPTEIGAIQGRAFGRQAGTLFFCLLSPQASQLVGYAPLCLCPAPSVP